MKAVVILLLGVSVVSASVAGPFGEYFEINEPGVIFHPWFGTAAGNCLYAINQMTAT